MQRIWELRTDAEPWQKRQHGEKLILLLLFFLKLYFFHYNYTFNLFSEVKAILPVAGKTPCCLSSPVFSLSL